MHSIAWTSRILSRALVAGITNYSVEANGKRRDPHLVYAVCGFPKDFSTYKYKKGQFGDDAWFAAKTKTAEVLGE